MSDDRHEPGEDTAAAPAGSDQTPAGSAPAEAEAGPPRGRGRDRQALKRKRRQVELPDVPEQRLRHRLRALFLRLEQDSTDVRGKLGVYAARVATQVVRQWARDRCFEKAASLAFQTVLSVVPLLALALVVLRWSGSIDAESSFVNYLSRELIPVSREVIAEKLSAWSANVSLQSLGLVGLLVTLLFAFFIVNSMENTINAIWRAERRRSLAQKFVVFYASVTIGPFLLGSSLYYATKYGLTEGHSGQLFSAITSYGAMFLANMFLPAVPVRVAPAALGALVTLALFEAARYAFQVYVTEFAFASYAGIYGALGLVPLWLVWVYYTWLMFLLGVEVAHVVQNISSLQRRDRRRPMSLENELLQRVNGVVAARIMLAIAGAYMRGDKVVPRRTLEEMFDLSPEVLGRIAERLKKSDLVIEVDGEMRGYVPARPPNEITLGQILAPFRGDDFARASQNPRTPLDRILADIERETRQRTEEIYLDQLV